MTVLGNWVVFAALLTSLLSAISYYRVASGNPSALRVARLWLRISSLSIVFASVLLLLLIVRHEFVNSYVYSYSSRSLPLHYLVSSFYAGQEGSFLFWALCSAVIVLFMVRAASVRGIEAALMTVMMGVQSFLLLLILAKSPFRFVWEVFPGAELGVVPADGRGLNPLLQNPWMVVHPPVLFFGFALMAVPFSFAIAGLWKRMFSLLSDHGMPWVLSATFVLGVGIVLGAYWAYGVLGWGGYWGWDPVENSSLVPWVTSVALVHTLVAQRRSLKYVSTNFALAIVSFVLVLYSTFLTRSGILGDASVHSFIDPGATVFWLLMAFIAVVLVTGIGMLIARRREFPTGTSDTALVSRESTLGAANVVLLLSAVIILFGTSLPIFSTTRVEPSFYDMANFPIAIAMALLIGFSLYVQWGTDQVRDVVMRSWKALAGSLVVGAAGFLLGVQNPEALLFIVAFAFAFFVNVDIGLRVARGDPRFLGGKIAHAGVALFFIGVIASGKYTSTVHVLLPLNVPEKALGRTMTYVGSRLTSDGKFAFDVVVEENGKQTRLSPVMFESGEQGVMRNPDIGMSFMSDLYVSPVSLDRADASQGHVGENYTLRKGETVSVGSVQVTFVKFDMGSHGADVMKSGGEGMSIGSVLELTNGKERETVVPMTLYRRDAPPTYQPSASRLMNGTIQLISMNVGMGTTHSEITVSIQRPGSGPQPPETLVVEASLKPLISLVWIGTGVLMVGFVLSILKRSKES